MRIRPEADFLTFCCRDNPLTHPAALRQRALAVERWDRVVQLASRHRVTAFLLRLLDDLAAGGLVPDWVVEEIRRSALRTVARTLRLRHALREVLAALEEEGVDVMVLKGAALGSLVYDDARIRHSWDIDLLCTEPNYERVYGILVSLGYDTEDESVLPARRAHEETHFERHFVHADGTVPLDLHVDGIKLGVRPRHSSSIWTRAKSIEVDGAHALALCAEDQVLMLSVHLNRHGFNRLKWFVDIDQLIRRRGAGLDWDMVIAEARAEGAEPSLWYTFHYLRKMFETPVPERVVAELRPNPLVRWAFFRIWPESRVLNLRSRTKRRAVQFSISESWRGTIPSLVLMGRRREKVGILVRRLLPF